MNPISVQQDLIPMGIMGVRGFQAYQQYEAGKEAKQAYYEEATELARQTAYTQRMALEEQREINREGRTAEGKAISAAAGRGLRVGGSVVTLAQAIQAKVERRKALVGMQFQEEARRNAFRIGQYHRAGRSAKKAGGYQAVESLLTGGLEAWDYHRKLGR